VEELRLLERASLRSPWSLADFFGQLAGLDHFRSIALRREAEPGGRTLAAYAAWFELEEELHLISMAVAPDLRRCGLGRTLMTEISRQSRLRGGVRITLEVRIGNTGAIAFYQSCGFIPVAIRERYYEDDGEHAVAMWIPASAQTLD
jgi:ribosomal-protein-alanine N-acetyltransferase